MSVIEINPQDFADPNFNVKNWINSALKPSLATESTAADDEDSKNTTIIVTKLQMTSEATSRQFDQLSNSILKSMPRILYDLKAISDDAKNTHEQVEKIKQNLGLMENNTEQVIETLHRPHTAKTRMEECRMILLEKSDHLNKIREEQEKRNREEQERKKREEEEIEKAAAAEEAIKLAMAKEEEATRIAEIETIAKEEEEAKARIAAAAAAAMAAAEAEELAEKVKEQKLIDKQQKEKEIEHEVEQVEEEEEEDDDEYGQVQLPPLRQYEPKARTTTLQQLNNAKSQNVEDNNGYLQQMTPQVSSVFKRIGVPLDKFWQT